MNKEYFTDNLSIETIAEITDEIIRFEKNNKQKNTKLYLLKIVPAAAAIVLMIGLANLIGLLNIDKLFHGAASIATTTTAEPTETTEMPTEEIEIKPGEEIPGYMPEYVLIGVEYYSTDLTELDLNSSQLTNADIEQLKYMVNLTVLNLIDNKISDISVLAGLTNLTKVNLDSNEISDISALAGLTNLTMLGLGDNNISDISVLAGLTNLTTLYLTINQINDVSALAELTNLEMLFLTDNQISDITALTGLTNLTLLYLIKNPLTYEQIAELGEALPNTEIFDK